MTVNRKAQLAAMEDEASRELWEKIEGLSPEQLERPGLTADGWSVKDLMWHIGAWSAECARVLERIRMGTYEDEDYDTDALNREWYELSRTLDLGTVRAEFASARNRMLQEWDALPEVTQAADEWFEESGPLHYREHAKQLEPWVATLKAPGPG